MPVIQPPASERLKDNYDALLLNYAAGMLDMAQTMAVSAHLTYSENARSFVKNCESIGGAVLENDCTPAEMSVGCLDAVLGKIEGTSCRMQEDHKHQCCPNKTTGLSCSIPAPIASSLTEGTKSKWKKVYPGFEAWDIQLQCKRSHAKFIKAVPGAHSPRHEHGGIEITLILDGALYDSEGQYNVGDLIVTDEHFDHAPIACKLKGCTCLIVESAPMKLKGFAGLLNPFLR